ncbi:MAG TPA: membrane protein insertase YidC, partial [Thiolinea sp.]|nr:membrane protein insertase YidC [Thiolinea sp.]
MDSQRPFLYLALIFLGFLLWTSWQQDHAPEPVVTETAQSTRAAGNTGTTIPHEVPNVAATSQPQPGNAPVQETDNGEQLIRVRTDVLALQISTRGGEIITADLPTYPVSLEQPDQPVRLLSRDEKNYVAQSGLLNQNNDPALAPNHLALFSAEQQEYALKDGQDSLVVPLRWQGANGLAVVKLFEFRRGSFSINMTQSLQNSSGQPWTGLEYLQFKHGPVEHKSSMMGIRAFEGGAIYEDHKYTRINFADMGQELEGHDVNADGGWVSILQHYFVSAWIPAAGERNSYYSRETATLGVPAYILGLKGPLISVADGASHTFTSQFWVGPKLQDELEALAPGLDLTVDYGVLAFISKPIFWVMQHIHSLIG